MKINGVPQGKKHSALGGKKISGAGGKKGGCFPALILVGLLGSGWAHMIATSAGWVS